MSEEPILNPSLLIALHALYERLNAQPGNWAITASCCLALQGVPVTVRDVDLATDREGAYRIEQLFAAEMVRPVQLATAEKIRSHFGTFLLQGYIFEIIGDCQYRNAVGGWSKTVDLNAHKRFILLEEMALPVLTLAYEVGSYVKLDRTEKVKLLEEYLRGDSG
jgi:hypothetical protein